MAAYRSHFGVLLGSAALLFLGAGSVAGLLTAVSPALGAVAFVALVVAQTWYAGVVTELLLRVRAGARRPAVGTLLGSVGERLGRLLGAGALAGVGIGLGALLLLVPGLYLATIWAVVAPVIVVEGRPVRDALRRSQDLVEGDGWQVFATHVLVSLAFVAIAVALHRALGAGTFVAGFVGVLLPGVLLAPIGALAAATVCFELRRIKDGAGAPAPTQAARDAA